MQYFFVKTTNTRKLSHRIYKYGSKYNVGLNCRILNKDADILGKFYYFNVKKE